MKVAVLSGKGGTGKTFAATNLAASADNGVYVDCDVEEPNGHLFFKPQVEYTESVGVLVPQVDPQKCSGCRKCVEFCKFNALAYAAHTLMVFEEMCHSCGGCTLMCPTGALTEKVRAIGQVERGYSEDTLVLSGFLNPGEESGVPIIQKLLTMIPDNGAVTVLDAPPGSACTVLETIQDVDYCILVGEPTVFGVHNLAVVYELVTLFRKPYGVIINKYLSQDNPVTEFCSKSRLNIIGSIPFEQELGKKLADGVVVARHNGRYERVFKEILDRIDEEVASSHEAGAGIKR